MFPYPILSDNSEAQHSSISIYIPSAGRSFMLEFLCWSSKDIWFWCFPNCFGLFGHLLFGFRYPGEIYFWFEGDQNLWEDHGSWFRFAGCFLVSWRIFSNNRWRPFRSWPFYLLNFLEFFWFLRRILFTSVPLYYFDLKSDWLPLLTFAFGSPPEVLLFRYLLFVTIR